MVIFLLVLIEREFEHLEKLIILEIATKENKKVIRAETAVVSGISQRVDKSVKEQPFSYPRTVVQTPVEAYAGGTDATETAVVL